MSLWSRICNALRPEAVDRELDAEIRTHLEQMREEGEDALDYGSVLRYREQSRDIKCLPWLETMRADVSFGWRQLMKKKTVTAVAAVSLALGIGSTTSVFRLVEAAFLRPLAIRDADRLYFLRYTAVNIDGKESEKDSFSYPELLVMRDALKDRCELLMVSFADRQDVTYGDPAAVEKISRQFVSGRLFEDFGLQAAAGRLFSRAEDESSADHRIAVISFPYWQRRFGLDPTIIGKTFRYQGDTYTIAGVVERGFTGTSTGSFTDVFLPLLANTEATRSARSARWAWARILVHLNRDASVEGVRDRVAGCDRSDCACLVCSGGGRASHPRHPLGSGADAALGINSL